LRFSWKVPQGDIFGGIIRKVRNNPQLDLFFFFARISSGKRRVGIRPAEETKGKRISEKAGLTGARWSASRAPLIMVAMTSSFLPVFLHQESLQFQNATGPRHTLRTLAKTWAKKNIRLRRSEVLLLSLFPFFPVSQAKMNFNPHESLRRRRRKNSKEIAKNGRKIEKKKGRIDNRKQESRAKRRKEKEEEEEESKNRK